MRYLVLAARPWAQELFELTLQFLPGEWEMLAEPWRADISPDKVFVLHWHYLLPARLVAAVPFIGFHASDLPKFRGGAPIRNQQVRGVFDTKLTAFRLDAGLDTGPICMQMPLSLRGTDEEVFERIAGLVARMMPPLLAGAYEERPQVGEPSVYTRADVNTA